jgi:hypothetical protein
MLVWLYSFAEALGYSWKGFFPGLGSGLFCPRDADGKATNTLAK